MKFQIGELAQVTGKRYYNSQVAPRHSVGPVIEIIDVRHAFPDTSIYYRIALPNGKCIAFRFDEISPVDDKNNCTPGEG